jgi:lysophospholipase
MNSSIKAGLAAQPLPLRWLENARGERMAFSEYPAAEPWLHLLISHGFGEHRGWYHHVAEALRGQGISTYTFDHFHHGESAGLRGDAPCYGALTEGLRLALEAGLMPGLAPGAKLGLLGHSNGALTVLRALGSLPPGRVSLVALSNPMLGLPCPLCWWAPILAALLGLAAPAMRVPMRTVPARLTADESIWPDYGRDPLRFRSFSVRFFKAMIGAARAARREANCQGLPLLLLFAERDPVVDGAATREWFERLNSESKKMISYASLHHELFNEREWEAVLRDLVHWLKERCGADSSPGTG